jgi:beta-lactamase class C
MHKTLAYISFLTCLLSVATPLSASEDMTDVVAEYDAFFRDLVSDRNYPGAAFAIVKRERVLHIGTFGHTNAARTQEIDAQTTFRLASVSKTFAAEIVGLLVEDGTLNWHDPVTRYVPDFKINGDTSQIQIRHLLGQSTGLMPHAYDNLLEHGKSMDTIWQRMSDLPYLCEPGKCYGYQNSIFSLVDPMVEQATTFSYESLINQRIFEPLDMTNASVGYEAFINNPNHAEPHARRKGKWKTVAVQRNYYRAAPAAGVNASIQDMGKWVQAQLGNKPTVISSEMLKNLQIPRVKTRRELYRKQWKTMLSDAHYGLGWRVYQLGDDQLIYHGGWVSGFRADVAFSPQHDLGIVVLLNAESSGISELTTRFWQMTLAP